MERCRNELILNHEKCKFEKDITIQLLDTITLKQNELIAYLENVSKTELIEKQNFIVDLSQNASFLLNKLFSINIDLESKLEKYSELSGSIAIIPQQNTIITDDPEIKTQTEEHKMDKIIPPITIIDNNSESFVKSSDDNAIISRTSDNTIKALSNAKCRFKRQEESVVTVTPDLSFTPESSSEYCSGSDSSDLSNVVSKRKHSQALSIKANIYKPPKEMDTNIELPKCEVPDLNDYCVITSVNSPDEIYITLEGNDNIKMLEEQLIEYAEGKESPFGTKKDAKKLIHKYCLAYSIEFESWNRAQVISWGKNDSQSIKVQFVDFGEYTFVPVTNIMPIPSYYCNLPQQALRCCIAEIKPLNSDSIWDENALNFLNTICFENRFYKKFRITAIRMKDGTIGIDLIDSGNEDGLTIREALIFNNCALNTDLNFNVKKTTSEYDAQSSNEMKQLDEFCDSLPTTYSSITEAMLGYDAQDDFRICKFTRKDGTCFKGNYCKLEHKKRRKGGVTVDTEDVFIIPQSNFVPINEDKIRVVLTHYSKVNTLYGQVHSEHDSRALFWNLFKNMNKSFNVEKYEMLTLPPAVGEFIIVKNTDDRWYRAKVLEVFSVTWSRTPLIKVLFIDFGDELSISFNDARKMTACFSELPSQATQFSISYIKSLGNIDLIKFKQFSDSVINNMYTVIVTDVQSQFIQGVFINDNGINLGEQLVNAGFAEVYDEELFPLPSSRICVD